MADLCGFCGKVHHGVCEAERAALERAVRILAVKSAVLQAARSQRGSSGVVECPICGIGTVAYTIPSYGQPIVARCSTEACVGSDTPHQGPADRSK